VSRWNLYYKTALELVEPEEWCRLIDALNELDSRCPIEIKGGMATFSGDGSTIVFNIAHGLTTTPTVAFVQKAIANLPDIDYIEVDTTYIKVYFKSPPPAGTDNIKLFYLAMRF
jgi:hypothetical protein